MSFAQALELGTVQGLTEFLPISSSAHLLLVPYVLGWPDQGLAVDAVLHAGTLIALLAYFRRDIAGLVRGALPRRLGVIIAVATLPAAAAGFLADDWIERGFRQPGMVAASTALAAGLMAIADRRASRPQGSGDSLRRVTWSAGIVVGVAQAFALVPGVSRSGITLTAGLLSGLDRQTAARFGFLLGIPVTAAAAAAKTAELWSIAPAPSALAPLGAALAAAAVTGWCAVWLLVSHLKRGSLMPFVVYRFALALALLAATAAS